MDTDKTCESCERSFMWSGHLRCGRREREHHNAPRKPLGPLCRVRPTDTCDRFEPYTLFWPRND